MKIPFVVWNMLKWRKKYAVNMHQMSVCNRPYLHELPFRAGCLEREITIKDLFFCKSYPEAVLLLKILSDLGIKEFSQCDKCCPGKVSKVNISNEFDRIFANQCRLYNLKSIWLKCLYRMKRVVFKNRKVREVVCLK
jgi:hypothetical protein